MIPLLAGSGRPRGRRLFHYNGQDFRLDDGNGAAGAMMPLVGGSLYRAARAAGVSFDAIADYLRTIAPHIDIDALRADDRFDMVMTRRRAATGEVETGEVETGRLLLPVSGTAANACD